MNQSHDWKHLYRSFSDLHRRYSHAYPNPQVGLQVLRELLRPGGDEDRVTMEAMESNIDVRPDWAEIELLRRALEHADNSYGLTPEAPAESVYQIGIVVKARQLSDALARDGEPRWMFRGQRCHAWATTPTIFRNIDDELEGERVLETRLKKTRAAVKALRKIGLGATDLEALAIAQHYSHELDISTWLLDLTASPYIALFFASYYGVPGDIGVLTYIERTEWIRFSDGGRNDLGAIRYVTPSGIPRIANQQAFFLDAPHPELYHQLVNRCYYFRQRAGEVFEDMNEVPRVSRTDIYPPDDLTLSRLESIDLAGTSDRTLDEPSIRAVRPPSAKVFMGIAAPFLENATDIQRSRIEELCKLHAALTRNKAVVPDSIVNLHYLRRAIEAAKLDLFTNLTTFFELFYIQELLAPYHAFEGCVRHEWHRAARKAIHAQLPIHDK
jgi:hypothetical protein